MAQRHFVKNVDEPDELFELERVRQQMVEVGDISVGWQVCSPGWRWSVDVKPHAGGDWCQARHVGIMRSGRLGVMLDDGTEFEIKPRDVYVIPPGHEGYTVGDEPAVSVEWSGARGWMPEPESGVERVLATVLMTDIVQSTVTAARLGDRRWRTVMAAHNERVREVVSRFRGREVDTTGDGFLITFDGAARAVRCAMELVRSSATDELAMRAAVHTGEVEFVGDRVRGIAVHEVARMMTLAGPGEILVSAVTRELTAAAGLAYEDRGEHELRGLEGARRLYAVSMPG